MKKYEIHFNVMYFGKGLKKEVKEVSKMVYYAIASSLLEEDVDCEIKQKWNRNYIRIGCWDETYFSLLLSIEKMEKEVKK